MFRDKYDERPRYDGDDLHFDMLCFYVLLKSCPCTFSYLGSSIHLPCFIVVLTVLLCEYTYQYYYMEWNQSYFNIL